MNLPSFLSREHAVKEFMKMAASIGAPTNIRISTRNHCADMTGSNNQDFKLVGEPLSMTCIVGQCLEPVVVSYNILERD